MRGQWRRMGGVLLALGLAVTVLPTGAQEQAQPDPALPEVGEVLEPLDQLARPVTILRLEKPVVTALLRGDHGDVRVTGSLEGTPQGSLRLTDPAGRVREVAWSEVRSLYEVDRPVEGFPAGSFVVMLISDPREAGVAQSPGGTYTSQALGTNSGGWRLMRLPAGNVTLRGEPYGTLTVPLARVFSLQREPLRGNVRQFPAGNIRLEVLDGKTVSLPLPDVQRLQRDPQRGTATVRLMDEQTFSGRLVELPRVSISVTTERGDEVSVPLQEVAQLERVIPEIRRF